MLSGSEPLILVLADWRFRVDVEETRFRTERNASDHCECAYCKNFYEAVDAAYPGLRPFLAEFGVHIAGPSELMPFEPTLVLACYRVQGRILEWGRAGLVVDGVQIVPEPEEDGTFLLWVGEMELPWLQTEPAEDVVSPANLPEFLERMERGWTLRHGVEVVFS